MSFVRRWWRKRQRRTTRGGNDAVANALECCARRSVIHFPRGGRRRHGL